MIRCAVLYDATCASLISGGAISQRSPRGSIRAIHIFAAFIRASGLCGQAGARRGGEVREEAQQHELLLEHVEQFPGVGQVVFGEAEIGAQLSAQLELLGRQVAGAPLQVVELGTHRGGLCGDLPISADRVGDGRIELTLLGRQLWSALRQKCCQLGKFIPRTDRVEPRFGHGAEVELRTAKGRPIKLLGCYHVSQRNTQTGVLTEDMLDAVLARLHDPIL